MISNPYTFSDDEKKLVKDHFSTHDDWYKSNFDGIRENLRDHLRVEQNNKCCYCKNELGFDLKTVDIEHIIPKSELPEFTFFGKNLALSCPGCNTIKHRKSVFLKLNKAKKYPTDGKNFKIIHAHYDEYDEHIEIINGSVYAALSAKGSETITMCELFRFRKAVEKAKKVRTDKTVISSMVEEIRQGGKDVDDFAAFFRSLMSNP